MADILVQNRNGRKLLTLCGTALAFVMLLFVGFGYGWLRAQAIQVGRWILVGPEAISGPVLGAPVEFWRHPRTDIQDVILTSVESPPGSRRPVHIGRNRRPIAQFGGFWIIEH